MKFFGKNTSIGKLDIDADATSAESPEMLKRLERISSNYQKLDAVLTDLETKFAADERLKPKEKKKSKPVTPAEDVATALPDSWEPPSANPQKPR